MFFICVWIYIEKECVNSCAMIKKNTNWSKNLFKKVLLNETPQHHNDKNVI